MKHVIISVLITVPHYPTVSHLGYVFIISIKFREAKVKIEEKYRHNISCPQ